MDDCTTILEVERAAAASAAPASTSQASRDDAKSSGEEDGDGGDAGEKWKGIGRVFPESCVIEDIDARHLVLIRDQFKNRDTRVSVLPPPPEKRSRY